MFLGGGEVTMQKIARLKGVFGQYQELDIDSYLKSLPYFLLTGRKGFYFFRNESTSVTVAVHPHKENTLLVFPEFDGDGSLTVEVLNELAKQSFDIQLARYTESDYQKLQKALADDKKRIIKSIKLKQEDLLDWRYPARILDTKAVAELQGKPFLKIRNKFNKVARSDNFEVVPFSDPEAEKIIQSTIYTWLAGLAFIGRETGNDVSEFYTTLAEQLKTFPSFFDGFAVRTPKEAIGFTIWDVTSDTANALAGLSKRSISGMSEFQTVTACRLLSEKGITRYNLGGSETENLDKYKLKFHPIESIEMSSYDVEVDTKVKLPFEMIDGLGHNHFEF